ncbi:MAG: hypothetical protein QHJ81_16450 [Anaerolineae bacterium]|nr:hypothetical protein [Anaerolineae bacterium]
MTTKRYYNERWNFSLTYPADWTIVFENDAGASWEIALAVASPDRRVGFIVNARRSEVLARHIQITMAPDGEVIQEPTTPQEFIQGQKRALAHGFPGFAFHTGEELTWLDQPAVKVAYSYDGDRERRKELCLTWFGVGLTLQFIGEAPAAEFERWETLFTQMLDGFHIGKGEDVVLPKMAALSPVELYNTGVALHREGRYVEAQEYFSRCYATGVYPMQAAYAISLCERALGRRPQIPPELAGRENETGAVYVASNLACYLIQEGHRAALVTAGRRSEVAAVVRGVQYRVQTSCHPVLGGFDHFVYRVDGETQLLLHPVAQAALTNTDRYLISLIEHASTLPLSPLPSEGLPAALLVEPP